MYLQWRILVSLLINPKKAFKFYLCPVHRQRKWSCCANWIVFRDEFFSNSLDMVRREQSVVLFSWEWLDIFLPFRKRPFPSRLRNNGCDRNSHLEEASKRCLYVARTWLGPSRTTVRCHCGDPPCSNPYELSVLERHDQNGGTTHSSSEYPIHQRELSMQTDFCHGRNVQLKRKVNVWFILRVNSFLNLPVSTTDGLINEPPHW